jgi:hypothetical protein
MTWTQRLKRVFQIDITSGMRWRREMIACIEDPAVIQKILTHLDKQEPQRGTGRLPQGRASARRSVRLTPSNAPRSTQMVVTRRARPVVVGLPVGMGRKAAVARENFSRSSFGLAVDHG